MKKMIAMFLTVFLVGAFSVGNAWAGDPVVDTLDRHAVWSKSQDDRKADTSESKDTKEVKKAKIDQVDVKVKIENKRWARVG